MKEENIFTLIAGPCVLENEETAFFIAEKLKEICSRNNINLIFKASFDKANRTSFSSFRGLGLNNAHSIFSNIKNELKLEILTDVHEINQIEKFYDVIDIFQIPAFLCRQTDLIFAVVDSIKNTNKKINIKKGQFLSPLDMKNVIDKVVSRGLEPKSQRVWITERGNCFGHNDLIVDFRGLYQMKKFECPIFFDATHSVQKPGGKGSSSDGSREYIEPLSRAAFASGVNGLFLEVHPNPDQALSDGPNSLPLEKVELLLQNLISLKKVVNNLSSI